MSLFKSFWNRLTAPSPGGQLRSFTPRAQQVLTLARNEAERLNHNFVGTEHLLLGIITLGQCPPVAILQKMGLEPEAVRLEVEKHVGRGQDQKLLGPIPFTPQVKKVIALAAKEAKALKYTYVGAEHILLGLLLEGNGVAARVLKKLGVNVERVRQEILNQFPATSPTEVNNTNLSERRQPMKSSQPQSPPVDTIKRYDVYCTEQQKEVVYRNALFKGRRKLLSTREHDFGAEFIELEQSNGQTVYLSLHSVRKFCEHGAEIVSEIVPPK